MSDIETVIRLIERVEDKVERRLDKVDSALDELSKTSAVNTAQLEENTKSLVEHIKRTNLLEDEQREFRVKTQDVAETVKRLEVDTEFLVKFPKMLYQLGKWLGAVGAIGTTLWFIVRLILDYMVK